MHPYIEEALGHSAAGRGIPAELAGRLAGLPAADLLDLMAAARLAAGRGGARPFACGIINAKSGRCPEDCAFCAQSLHHAGAAAVYPLVSEDALLRRAGELAAAGAAYMGIVISGTRPSPGDLERLARAAEKIVRAFPLRLCASFGLLSREEAVTLRQAGFASCHHNLETAPSHYPAVCATHSIEARLETARAAKAAGLRLCAGGIFGLGETWAQRLELSDALAELDVDSIPVNFLTPIPGTPLAGAAPLAPGEALAIIAILRLLHPGRDIVVCGGRWARLGAWSDFIFPAGANGVMIGNYLTTPGRTLPDDLATLGLFGITRS